LADRRSWALGVAVRAQARQVLQHVAPATLSWENGESRPRHRHVAEYVVENVVENVATSADST
jgi:hypothetical protein